MARHSLYPGFIRIVYTSGGHPHHQVLPVNADPTPVGASFTIPTRGGTPVDWQTAVTAYATLLAAMLDDASSVDYAELYNFEAEPAPADYLATYPLGVSGTSAFAAVPLTQVVFPFKGAGGLSCRPYVMEGVTSADMRQTYAATTDAAFLAFMNFVLGASDWIAMRGGGFPTAALGWVSKVNDQLRKRYFVP